MLYGNTYAIISLQVSDDVKTAQENLAHHTFAFALDVYGYVSERIKVESAARRGQAYKHGEGYFEEYA